MKKYIIIYLLFFFPLLSIGQKIDHTASFRDIGEDSYFRFNYDNDFFASDDRDYTQGYNFELATPWLRKNPANILFYLPKNTVRVYGLAIEHIGFTPQNIKSPEIQFGDRPFAAAIVLKSFVVTTDSIQKSRFISALSIGMIGPAAFGREMQVAIHEATSNPIPEGWRNQISNDVIINYEIGYERQLFRFQEFFAVNANAHAKLGTLFTNASVGFNTSIGILNHAFLPAPTKKGLMLYAYYQPMVTAVGYDASLQGGLFNNDNPYTIGASSVNRFTAQHNYGLVLQTKKLFFEYSRTNSTREFDQGTPGRWGGFRIGFVF